MLFAWLGLQLEPVGGFATLVWPAAGIALASLWLAGPRYWPAVYLGAVIVNTVTGAPLLTAAGIALGNTLEALIGVHLLRRARFQSELSRVRDATCFVIFGVILNTLLAALIGPLVLAVSGVTPWTSFFTVALTWWVGDMMGSFIVAPVLFLWSRWPGHSYSRRQWAEIFFLMLALVVVLGLVFGPFAGPDGNRFPKPYFVFILILWAAARFSPRETAALALLISAGAVLGTLHGYGLFASPSLRGSLAQLQTFVATVGSLALFMGAYVAELRRAQIELTNSKEAADAANRSKTAFLATISHEIRTPLAAMLGFNDLLRDNSLGSGERNQFLDIIRRNGIQLSHLIDDILDLSKVEARRLDVEIERVNVRELTTEITSLLRPMAQQKNVELKVDFASEVPQEILTDGKRLRQILMNIVGNAIKFTDYGKIEITVQNSPTRSGVLAFHVRDSGPGIPLEQQSRLFQPFTQLDNSMTRRHGGTGLGLSLARKLAQALGGDIELVESSSQGSLFVATIQTGWEKPLTKGPISIANARAAGETQRDLENLQVLVVEDSLDNQALVRQMLQMKGAEVTLADNGQHGVELALRKNFDVILMDLQMPVLDGYSAVHKLREQGYQRPIIALTAHALLADREKCMQVGCNEYLTKPIAQEDLVRAIWQCHHQFSLHSGERS